jgi:hypothetical protein
MPNCQKIIDGYEQIEPYDDFKDVVYELQGLDFPPLKNNKVSFVRGSLD